MRDRIPVSLRRLIYLASLIAAIAFALPRLFTRDGQWACATRARLLKTAAVGLMLVCHALAGEWFAVQIPSPTYPLLANQAGIEGLVRLKLTLDGSGAVLRAEVLSGPPVLARSARDNAVLWKFATPCPDGKTSQTIEFTYDFRLEGEVDARPRTRFHYEHPYRAIVISEALHWMP